MNFGLACTLCTICCQLMLDGKRLVHARGHISKAHRPNYNKCHCACALRAISILIHWDQSHIAVLVGSTILSVWCMVLVLDWWWVGVQSNSARENWIWKTMPFSLCASSIGLPSDWPMKHDYALNMWRRHLASLYTHSSHSSSWLLVEYRAACRWKSRKTVWAVCRKPLTFLSLLYVCA